ncbi:MAG: hypothetical protein EHM45_03010 [Desulfobacteraceae bacterium]|nr:MAG: hypothetical protein EHM45_03010 [Desulfobacteraceae bacterium]
MNISVNQMTRDELQEMIENSIERKLIELLGDPDKGLPIRKSMRDRLIRQKKSVTKGARGETLESIARRLDLE